MSGLRKLYRCHTFPVSTPPVMHLSPLGNTYAPLKEQLSSFVGSYRHPPILNTSLCLADVGKTLVVPSSPGSTRAQPWGTAPPLEQLIAPGEAARIRGAAGAVSRAAPSVEARHRGRGAGKGSTGRRPSVQALPFGQNDRMKSFWG